MNHLTTASGVTTILGAETAPSGEAFVHLPNTDAWNRCARQLSLIRKLEANWDGAGSDPISSDLIDSAFDILNQIKKRAFENPPSGVIASPSGSVVIEWHTRNSYRGAEIERPYVVEWMVRTPAGKRSHEHQPEKFIPSRMEPLRIESILLSYPESLDKDSASGLKSPISSI